MTDRELLEAAAKACGNRANSWSDSHKCLFTTHGPYPNTYEKWNPLTDDGDALRLFTKLPFRNLYVSEIGVTVFLPNKEGEIGLKCDEYADEHNGDLSAATRRAIVRAAAEIGEKL